jgi:septum formation protein
MIAGKVVLASSSPTRASMLAAIGFSVTRDPPRVDEEEVKLAFQGEGADPAACAVALAEAKADRVSRRHPGALVIGADQMLDCEGVWFDKPPDRRQARAQLVALRGRTHVLTTAACVFRDGQKLWHTVQQARLTMRSFSDDFLDEYLSAVGDDVTGSVGAYRLEGQGVHLFARVEGDWFTILGLPILPLLDFLRGQGAAGA